MKSNNFKLHTLEEIDSTINYAKNYLQSHKFLGNSIAFMAKSQSKGVGKMGNTWDSPKGNLYLSVIFKKLSTYNWHNYYDINIFNLELALSLIITLIELLGLPKNSPISTFPLFNNSATNNLCSGMGIKQSPSIPHNLLTTKDKAENYIINCKWPNDVLINNSKVSGILVEKIIMGEEVLLLASFGVNIVSCPNIPGYPTTCLQNINNRLNFSPKDIALRLINNIFTLAEYTKGEVINNWLSYAYKLHEEITIKIGNNIKKGIFLGLNPEGNLLLQTTQQLEKIALGEIYQ